MIVLVTGGAGYIGSHLVKRLLGAGHEVRVLDRLDYGGASLLGECGASGFSLIKGDVNDTPLLRRAARGADAIVHLAARVGFPACQRDPQDAVRSNVEGTKAVLEELGTAQRLIFASTASVYGAAGSERRNESCPVSPLSLYARTKVEAEDLVRAAGDPVILRFATAFGVSTRMRFDLLPNDLIRIVLRDGRLELYEPEFRRCFIHVQDIAAAVHHALDNWTQVAGQTFNVSDPALNMTKLDLARQIAQLVPYRLKVGGWGHDSDERDYYLSSDKFSATGFRAISNMADGLRKVMTAVRLLEGTGYRRPTGELTA
jgi:nucleoside-diphosphate-sugar epimerase